MTEDLKTLTIERHRQQISNIENANLTISNVNDFVKQIRTLTGAISRDMTDWIDQANELVESANKEIEIARNEKIPETTPHYRALTSLIPAMELAKKAIELSFHLTNLNNISVEKLFGFSNNLSKENYQATIIKATKERDEAVTQKMLDWQTKESEKWMNMLENIIVPRINEIEKRFLDLKETVNERMTELTKISVEEKYDDEVSKRDERILKLEEENKELKEKGQKPTTQLLPTPEEHPLRHPSEPEEQEPPKPITEPEPPKIEMKKVPLHLMSKDEQRVIKYLLINKLPLIDIKTKKGISGATLIAKNLVNRRILERIGRNEWKLSSYGRELVGDIDGS